jgi:hypothetical protein
MHRSRVLHIALIVAFAQGGLIAEPDYMWFGEYANSDYATTGCQSGDPEMDPDTWDPGAVDRAWMYTLMGWALINNTTSCDSRRYDSISNGDLTRQSFIQNKQYNDMVVYNGHGKAFIGGDYPVGALNLGCGSAYKYLSARDYPDDDIYAFNLGGGYPRWFISYSCYLFYEKGYSTETLREYWDPFFNGLKTAFGFVSASPAYFYTDDQDNYLQNESVLAYRDEANRFWQKWITEDAPMWYSWKYSLRFTELIPGAYIMHLTTYSPSGGIGSFHNDKWSEADNSQAPYDGVSVSSIYTWGEFDY